MLPGILAVIVGYRAVAVIVMLTTMAAAAALIHGGRAERDQPAWYALTILGIGVAGALAGGWVRLLVVGQGLPTEA